jgi:site-specific recombinase XerD
MREAEPKPASCNISIRAINSYLSWLYENEFVKERLRIKQPKAERKVIEPYTDEELHKALNFKPRDFYEWRLYVLASLLIDTGYRIQEVLRSVSYRSALSLKSCWSCISKSDLIRGVIISSAPLPATGSCIEIS